MPPVPAAARDPWPGKYKSRKEDAVDPSAGAKLAHPARSPPTEEEREAKAARRVVRKVAQRDELRARGLHDTASLAALLNVSKVHIRRLVKAGKLPAPFYATERRPLWRHAVIEEWLIARELGAKGSAAAAVNKVKTIT